LKTSSHRHALFKYRRATVEFKMPPKLFGLLRKRRSPPRTRSHARAYRALARAYPTLQQRRYLAGRARSRINYLVAWGRLNRKRRLKYLAYRRTVNRAVGRRKRYSRRR